MGFVEVLATAAGGVCLIVGVTSSVYAGVLAVGIAAIALKK